MCEASDGRAPRQVGSHECAEENLMMRCADGETRDYRCPPPHAAQQPHVAAPDSPPPLRPIHRCERHSAF